jgi:hypothetical protein
MGPHCENTKAWPFCLSAAGLGLKMYDNVFDKSAHSAYKSWLDYTKDKYYGFDKKGTLQWVTMYYDALKNHHHKIPPAHALAIAFYAKPQAPEFAELLYREGVRFLKWDDPNEPISGQIGLADRMLALGLSISKEFDDQVTYERLRKFAEENFEPRYFGLNDSQFGFWFNLGENWPRGQLSALAMCAEVCDGGAWEKLFNQPNLTKYYSPTIHGIDFPAVGVRQAWHDDNEGLLVFQIEDGDRTKTNKKTKVSVSNIPDTNQIEVFCDGKPFNDYSVDSSGQVVLNTEVANHLFHIRTGYVLSEEQKKQMNKGIQYNANQPSVEMKKGEETTTRLLITRSVPSLCGCC